MHCGHPARYGCIRCEVQGCLKGGVTAYTRTADETISKRSHASIIGNGKKALRDKKGTAVKGVKGLSPFFSLPYFDAVKNTVLDSPMHLLKGVFQSHILKVLVGKRIPGVIKAPLGKLWARRRGEEQPRRGKERARKEVTVEAQREYERKTEEREAAVKMVEGVMLTEEGARVAGAFLSRCPAPVSIVCGDLPELVFNGSSVTKFGIASWGMKLNASLALRSPVKVVSSIPPTAKSGIVNADEVKGMVVLVDRDMGCKFVDTAKMAVAAGAVAVIIANNDAEKGDAYFAPGGETDSSCPIPVVMISFSAAVAMRNAPAMHVELLYPGLHVDTTHANFIGKTLGSGGGKLVASLVRNSRVLSKVTCGGAKRWQKRSMCDGASFDVGKAVQCLGLQCIVTKPVDSRGDLKVQYPTAVLECSMTEIDLSGLYFRSCDLMIVTAFISSKCQ